MNEENTLNIRLTAIIEALLFLSPQPLSHRKLEEICQVKDIEIEQALEEIDTNLRNQERGLMLLKSSEGYQLATKPQTAFYVEKFLGEGYESNYLSQAALETLAIIAVKQPVTRMEIENIRGVKADGVIENLLKRDLIEITGRKEGLGRPFLYGTTVKFLREFGLNEVSELEKLNQELSTYLPENGETK